jgi:hypothetical protein
VDLVDDLRPRGVSPLDEAARLAEGKRNHRGLSFEGGLEGLLVQQRHYVVDREGPTRHLAHAPYLRPHAIGGLEDGTDTPKAPGLRDRGDQLRHGCRPDGRLHDGDLDG